MRYQWLSPSILFAMLVDFVDLVMMRRAMLGIKARAESLAQARPESRRSLTSQPRPPNRPQPVGAPRSRRRA